MDYRNIQEVRAKLKDQVISIKLKATGDSTRIVELYHSVKVISAKIKVSGSLSLLENDKEYIILVLKHLPKDIAWKWYEQDLISWSNLSIYLEAKANTARKISTNESINTALSGVYYS